MGWKAFLATLLSALLVYAPVAPAASATTLGKISTKGSAAINGSAVPAEATIFSGDRISTAKETASGLSLSGGNQVFLPALTTAQLNRVGNQVTVHLERGALAVINRSSDPVVVEANGVQIRAGGNTTAAVYEVAINGSALKVMARKGTALVKGSNRTVEVKEGTAIDATTPPNPQMGAGGLSPLWTVVVVSSAAAGFTGLALGVSALGRAKPQDCTVVSPNSIQCP